MRLPAFLKRPSKLLATAGLILFLVTLGFHASFHDNVHGNGVQVYQNDHSETKNEHIKELIIAQQKKHSRDFAVGLNEAEFQVKKGIAKVVKYSKDNLSRKENERKLQYLKSKSSPVIKAPSKINLTELKRVKNFGFNMFLYTAIVGNSSTKASWDRIAIQGWEDGRLENKTSICCVLYKSGMLRSFKMIKKISWAFKDNTPLPVKQYVCPNAPKTKGDYPTHATISAEKCHSRFNWYVQTEFAYRHQAKIAVCTKIAYGSLPADDIISWFEVQKLMGVTKVVTYAYNLNDNATKVLKYYEKQGMAEIIPFFLPKEVPYRPKVDVGTKSYQGWNDEQIPVFDCLERLRGYTYLVTIDMDEYLIPNKDRTWFGLFRRLWKYKPKAAGFTFLVKLYITSWGPTNSSADFKIGRYLNRTAAMSDRMKHVTLPARLAPGGLGTHSFGPQFSNGYHKSHAPMSYATLHHFRSCRKEWTRKTGRCYTLARYRDESVARLYRKVEHSIMTLKSNLTV